MPRNAQREPDALRWKQAVLLVFAVSLVAALTVGLVLQRQVHERLGERKIALESEARRLRSQTQQLEELVARNSSWAALAASAARFHLGLTNISPSQRLFIDRQTQPRVVAAAP